MALLSDRQGFDRLATIRCQAAIESQKKPFTILDAAQKGCIAAPVTEDDLRGFIRTCDTWGIRVNVDQEKWWKDYL